MHDRAAAASLPSRDDTARLLAHAHRRLDSGVQEVYRLLASNEDGDPNEPVKLLEINTQTTTDGIVPVYFGKDVANGVMYNCAIVEIHPSEWPLLQQRRLELPNGWRIGERL